VSSFLKPATLFFTLGIAISAFSQVKVSNRITQAIDDRETAQLRGTLHPLLQHATDQGRMDGGIQLGSVSLTFKRTAAQEAAVEKLLAEQQDPKSANYHKWLTPEQYADRFGLSTADLNKVVSWLQSEGFTVNRVARGRTEVWFAGSVSQIETVFRTEMHRYNLNGENHFAHSTELAVPAAIADVVLGVHGLSDFRPRARAHIRKISPEEVKANFTSSLSGSHFLIPGDFATIYELKTLYANGFDGNGQQLAVMGQSAINTADLDAFRTAASLPARTSSNFEQVLVPNSGTSTVVSGDVGESSLDLEWAQGIAHGATEIFVYVGNGANSSVFDAFTYAIDNNLAPVISMSYGNCEQNLPSSFIQSMQTLTQQANTQGQTIAAASGDFGAADCENSSALPATGGLAVDIPGALPSVTSVGGTEFTGDAAATVDPSNSSCYLATTYWAGSCGVTSGESALLYIPETAWNDTTLTNSLSATGGGASGLFPKPSWQTGTGVPNDGHRDVPDIALAASPNHDGFLLCSSGSCVNGFRDGTANNGLNVAGGTSFGAPTFAGMVAIWNEAVASQGQGNVNPKLYSNVSAFHDITTGNNQVPCASGSPNCPTSGTLVIGYKAGTGYDLVTGLGSPKGNTLISASSGYVSTPDYVLSKNATVTIAAAGQSATSSITISGINGFSGQVSLSCTPPSTTSEISCTIPSSVTVGASPTTAALTISTTKAHALAGPTSAASVPGRVLLWLAGGGAIVAGVFAFGIPAGHTRSRVAFMLLAVCLVGSAVACSGGGGSSTPKDAGTPAGTYTVGVTASGASSHTTSVTVVVQ
jgi:subtilase family serine protease